MTGRVNLPWRILKKSAKKLKIKSQDRTNIIVWSKTVKNGTFWVTWLQFINFYAILAPGYKLPG